MTEDQSNESIILPGQTIGMVGGGQLGRMFAIAAMQMGYDVVVLCTANDEPAAQVATKTVTGDLLDREVVRSFASQCDVISLEFENIPAETIRWCGEHAATYPSHHVLATAQDRLIEKQTFQNAGLAVTPVCRGRLSRRRPDFCREPRLAGDRQDRPQWIRRQRPISIE